MKAQAVKPARKAARKEPAPTTLPLSPLPHSPLPLQRKSCACGGGCPRCKKEMPLQNKLEVSAPSDALEQEADRAAEAIMRMPAAGMAVPRAERATPILRRQVSAPVTTLKPAPRAVHDTLASAGTPLDAPTRAFMEPRFGCDFGDVRVHTDARATESAAAVDALAYTVGAHIVFGRSQYAPASQAGRRLLAHELGHVVQQQQSGAPARLRRTPARQVSCAPGPLHLPGPPPLDIADPVDVITTAENTANQLLDDLIGELEFTRTRIIGGAPVAWPTISDGLAFSVRLMGLDPDDPAVWTAPTGTGLRSVPLLLRRLRLIRGTIGAGSFFFTCLGPDNGAVGHCVGPICAGGNVVVSCPGEFRMVFCEPFWRGTPEDRAARIIHESAHNFAAFVGHAGRFVNAECFARAAQMFGGVAEGLQRTDLCPNP